MTQRASAIRIWKVVAMVTIATGLPAAGAATPAPRPSAASAPVPTLASVVVAPLATDAATTHEGRVEALRQTIVAPQVSGAIVELGVRAGDRVQAGQLLARIDARSAAQGAIASDAQVAASRAQAIAAGTALARQRELHARNYISRAALEQAQAANDAAQAQLRAATAQSGAARTQSGLHLIRAPYAGIVSNVAVTLGDMAMPGRALLTLHDPTALRVSAAVPASDLQGAQPDAGAARIEIPALGAAAGAITPSRLQVLPTVDPQSMTQTVRAELPPGITAVPGQFARLTLPARSAPEAGTRGGLAVPTQAIVRRSELTAVYVLDASGMPLLRQVRLGRTAGGRTEVLAGLDAGEHVVTDPARAARAGSAKAAP